MKTTAAAIGGFIVGIISMWVLQNLVQAGQASKDMRSIAEARNVSIGLERYRAANGQYPPIQAGVSDAERYVVP